MEVKKKKRAADWWVFPTIFGFIIFCAACTIVAQFLK
jgi:hypothetical protein